MLFRQLFDRETCTYTYLLADEASREAVLIDPVRELVDRDAALLDELGLELKYTLETHVHADHITGSGLLREKRGSKSVLSHKGGAPCVDMTVSDGDRIEFGGHSIEVRETPGHTEACVSYYVPEGGMVFTGDTLFIRGCGRTDFQEGDARTLYSSVHDKIFSLPDSTRVFPGHDYKGRTESTVAEEKSFNPRLGGGKSVDEFVGIMDNLNLALPKKIDVAVPANQRCGLLMEATEEEKITVRGWAPVVRSMDGIPEVNVAWSAGILEEGYRFVDVRGPDEFRGPLGHVPNSSNIPLTTVAAAAKEWDPMEPVVLVCRSGGRSATAAALLESMGFAKVASMAGGMVVWNQAGLAVEF